MKKKAILSILTVFIMFFGLISTVNAATINFYMGSDSDEIVGTMTGVSIMNTPITVPDPTKKGFRFNGWEGVGNNVHFSTRNPGNIRVNSNRNNPTERVNATWVEKDKYNITYVLEGGTVEGNPDTYTEDDSFTLNNPTKDGFEFLGWIDEQGADLGTTVTIQEGTTGDLTFTAAWKEVPEEATEATDDATTTTKTVVNNPKTGDNIFYSIIMVLFGTAGIVGLSIVDRKRATN